MPPMGEPGPFVPASNLKRHGLGSNWRFVLPSLAIERLVCVGSPTPAALAGLSGLTQEAIVLTRASEDSRSLLGGRPLPDNVRVETEASARSSLPPASVDLAVILGPSATVRLRTEGGLQKELGRLLKPSGLVYLEVDARRTEQRLLDELVPGLHLRELLWLAPSGGEVTVAAPLADPSTIGYLAGHLREDSGVRRTLSVRLRTWAGNLARRDSRRRGVVLSRERPPSASRPPAYLCEIAAASGIDLTSWRWGLSSPGRYSSKKTLFFLFPDQEERPAYVAKMTRAPEFNARLDRERSALTLLEENAAIPAGTIPRVVFSGHHGGLAIVGETAVGGTPFRDLTSGRADCPFFRAALDWLVELAAATADHGARTPPDVASWFTSLFTQFAAVYRISEEHRTFLGAQIARLEQSGAPLPAVFQHGDPGTWNVRVGGEGQLVFLDWEAAEPNGMPLWDILYFCRSYGRTGDRWAVRPRLPRFLADPELRGALITAVDDLCARTGLRHAAIEPLFYACWMHRALKEATRLEAGRIEQGNHVNLVRACIDAHDHQALRALFSARDLPMIHERGLSTKGHRD